MALHTSVPGAPGEPRRGATVACPDHPDDAVETRTVETLVGSELVARTTWLCGFCSTPLTPETTP